MSRTRSRAFCFTINNYTEYDCKQVLELSKEARYLICGKEVGESGTPHLQGYVYFANARGFDALKLKIPRAHILAAKGTGSQNRTYCSKGGSLLCEAGEIPKQGARTDLERVKEMLKNGGRMRDVVEEAQSYQSVKMAEQILKYHEKERDWKPEVRWYCGPTGAGKTKAAREWLGSDIYTTLDTVRWFEGYDAHENVCIDDMRKDFAKFHQLLKLIDRYPYRVEMKGGSRQFLAKKIAITCPYRPEELYTTREDVAQLLRRIDVVTEFYSDGSVKTSNGDDQSSAQDLRGDPSSPCSGSGRRLRGESNRPTYRATDSSSDDTICDTTEAELHATGNGSQASADNLKETGYRLRRRQRLYDIKTYDQVA